jgi:hypothetical protein
MSSAQPFFPGGVLPDIQEQIKPTLPKGWKVSCCTLFFSWHELSLKNIQFVFASLF